MDEGTIQADDGKEAEMKDRQVKIIWTSDIPDNNSWAPYCYYVFCAQDNVEYRNKLEHGGLNRCLQAWAKDGCKPITNIGRCG